MLDLSKMFQRERERDDHRTHSLTKIVPSEDGGISRIPKGTNYQLTENGKHFHTCIFRV